MRSRRTWSKNPTLSVVRGTERHVRVAAVPEEGGRSANEEVVLSIDGISAFDLECHHSCCSSVQSPHCIIGQTIAMSIT